MLSANDHILLKTAQNNNCPITSTDQTQVHHNPFSGMDAQHGHALHITRSFYAFYEIKAQK
jgi:hypothetical protein